MGAGQVYSAADVFILDSRDEGDLTQEGFGLSFLEAGICGVPVVGTRTGGITDAVVHGRTGLMVEPGNVVDTADAVVRLLSDKAFAQRLGQAGRSRALREVTWDRVADRFESALYQWGLGIDAHK